MSNFVANSGKLVSTQKVNSSKDMKEYAETAMNELLGWYGYDKLSNVDSQALNLCIFSSAPTPSSSVKTKASVLKEITFYEPAESLPSLDSSSSSICSDDDGMKAKSEEKLCTRQQNNESAQPVSQLTNKATILSSELSHCTWCQKSVLAKNVNSLPTADDRTFCSEKCVAQHRQVYPKRNKICDWCRHVRHTVTSVDLRDGDSQYQFCSDKCLNQFKLDIFCQETKEHLEMHPHHQKQLNSITDSPLSSLITPDLWLRNCTSPSNSDKSRSSTPVKIHGSTSLPELTLVNMNFPEDTANFHTLIETKNNGENVSNEFSSSRYKSGICTLNETIEEPKNISSKCNLMADLYQKDKQHHRQRYRQRQHQRLQHQAFKRENIQLSSKDDKKQPRMSFTSQSSDDNKFSRNASNLQIPPLLPITKSPSPTKPQSCPPVKHLGPTDFTSLCKSLLPPTTLIVPYPVIVPLPLPVPIPLPLPLPVKTFLSESNQSINDASKLAEENASESAHNEGDGSLKDHQLW